MLHSSVLKSTMYGCVVTYKDDLIDGHSSHHKIGIFLLENPFDCQFLMERIQNSKLIRTPRKFLILFPKLVAPLLKSIASSEIQTPEYWNRLLLCHILKSIALCLQGTKSNAFSFRNPLLLVWHLRNLFHCLPKSIASFIRNLIIGRWNPLPVFRNLRRNTEIYWIMV